jgi:hypothetical protein
MIYNLVQYLRGQFPTEVFYANVIHLVSGQQSVPDRIVLVRESGGFEQPWTRFSEPTVQIITRDTNQPASRKLAYDIFNDITSRFGLILPSIVIGATTYNEIQTAQISAIQKPFCLGADENGRIEFTTNYKVIFTEGGS